MLSPGFSHPTPSAAVIRPQLSLLVGSAPRTLSVAGAEAAKIKDRTMMCL